MKKWLIIIFVLVVFSVIGVSAQSDESTAIPEPLPNPTWSETATPTFVEPLLGLAVEPPMEITLPEGWQRVLLDTYLYHDIVVDTDGQLETVPIAVYHGPVTGGDGWIVVLWGFDSITSIDTPLEQYTERAAWLDGLRMLQFVVFDIRCNIGTAPQREYTIGDYPAIGTTFSAVDCPFSVPDTRGWFAAIDVQGLNFVFYMYMDPIPPPGSQAEFDLQGILDTVVFHVEDLLVTRAEFDATREAYLSQLIESTPEVTPEATAKAAGQ